MSADKKDRHIAYFDFLRVFSMLGVIIMHLSSAYLQSPANRGWKLLVIPNSVFFVAVPVFFMISGALILSSPETSDPASLKRRIPRLVIPLLLWSACTLILDNLAAFIHTGSFDMAGYIKELGSIFLHEAAPPYWFMYYLIPLYLLSPALKAMAENLSDKGWRWLGALVLIVVLYKTVMAFLPDASAKADIPERLFILSGCLAYFFFGYRLRTAEIQIKNGVLLAVILIDTAVISAGTIFLSKNGEFVQTFQTYNLVFTAILAVSVFLLAKQNEALLSDGAKKVFAFLSKRSYGVYLIHVPVIFLLPSAGINIASAKGMLISFVLVPLVCFVITELAMRIKPFSYILTGCKYNRKGREK